MPLRPQTFKSRVEVFEYTRVSEGGYTKCLIFILGIPTNGRRGKMGLVFSLGETFPEPRHYTVPLCTERALIEVENVVTGNSSVHVKWIH